MSMYNVWVNPKRPYLPQQPIRNLFFPPHNTSNASSPLSGIGSSIGNLWGNICSEAKQAAQKLGLGLQVDQINQQAEQEGNQLIPKICKVMASIQKFDRFICERPNLLELCQRYLQEDSDLIAISLTGAVHFAARELDPRDPLDRLVQLTLKFNRLNYLWAERLRFIRRHPLLEERMIAHINRTMREEARGVNLLEYKTSTDQIDEEEIY